MFMKRFVAIEDRTARCQVRWRSATRG